MLRKDAQCDIMRTKSLRARSMVRSRCVEISDIAVNSSLGWHQNRFSGWQNDRKWSFDWLKHYAASYLTMTPPSCLHHLTFLSSIFLRHSIKSASHPAPTPSPTHTHTLSSFFNLLAYSHLTRPPPNLVMFYTHTHPHTHYTFERNKNCILFPGAQWQRS